MHRLIAVLVVVLFVHLALRAEEGTDTLGCSREGYRMEWRSTILPASLIGAGAVAAAPTFVRKGSETVTRGFINMRSGRNLTEVDDYTQYIPMAGALGLGLCGVPAKHDFVERWLITTTSAATMCVITKGVKICVSELRPDGSKHNSFPSGHTATAFMGAELMRIEYGRWWGLGGYAVATFIGCARMYNSRHWLHDVAAGAGIGILSARMGEWSGELWHRLLNKRKQRKAHMMMTPAIAPDGNGVTAAIGLGATF